MSDETSWYPFGWRSIDAAPLDRIIAVFCPAERGMPAQVVVGYFRCDGKYVVDVEGWTHSRTATHWIDLP